MNELNLLLVAAQEAGLAPAAVSNLPALLSVLALGFTLGLKHAVDADHLIAVSTLVSEQKKLWQAVSIGALWGLGHTLSLLVVGIGVLFLSRQIPPRMAAWLEFGVGAMLIFLGIRVLIRLLQAEKLHFHIHEHGGRRHAHFHMHRRTDSPGSHSHHPIRSGKNSLLVGMVHGMAGSAALMLLILATIPSKIAGILYILIFGLGCILGMMIMSLVLSFPFSLTAHKMPALQAPLQLFAGLLSVGFGGYLMYTHF